MIQKNYNKMTFCYVTDFAKGKGLRNFSYFNKKQVKVYPWKTIELTNDEVRPDIKLVNHGNSKLLYSFKLDQNCYSLFNLDFKRIWLLPKNNLKEIGFAIEDIYIHLFDTGIFFLDIEYRVLSNDEEEIAAFNYFLSEIKSDVILKQEFKVFNPETKQTSIEEKVVKVEEFIKKIIPFERFENIDGASMKINNPLRPILFSYQYADDEEIKESNLAHNFKSSYKINDSSVKQSAYFENSTWYYANNSITNISHKIDDNITNQFFENAFKSKVFNLYFFLYLIAIHEKVSMMLSMKKVREISFGLQSLNDIEKKCEDIALIKARINEFKFKYCILAPAILDHINLYYENVREAFKNQVLLDSLNQSLVNIEAYSTNINELNASYKALFASKRSAAADIIILLTASIVSFASLYDTFLKVINNFKLELTVNNHIMLAIGFMIVCFAIPTAFNLVKNIKKIKKLNADIQKKNEIIERYTK